MYGDFQYVFELDEHFRAYRVDKNKVKSQENDREHLMTSVLASPQQWEKMKADKEVVLAAVKTYGSALYYASEEFQISFFKGQIYIFFVS